MAQDVGGAVIELEDIVVFGGLLPTNLDTTGATIDVANSADIQREGASATAALDLLPGVSVSANGGLGSSATVRIRGLSGPYVGVRIDGIDVTDPSGPQTAFNFGRLTTGSLDRLAVVKGTQSAVYGSEAIAGVVEVETWRPEVSGVSGKAQLELGSFETRSANLSFGYLDDRAELALSLGRVTSEGYSARDTDDENDGFEQSLVNLFAAYQVSDAIRIGFNGFWSEGTAEYDQAATDPRGEIDETRRGVRMFGEVQAGAWTHELSFSRYEIERFDPVGFTRDFLGERDTVAYLATGDLSSGVSLAFGADWSEERAALDGDAYDASNSAVFAEVKATPTDAVELSLTLRYDDYSDFDGQLSGRAALSYRLDEATTVRASLGTGYRAPSLYERFGPYAGSTPLDPEESLSFDLGIEHSYGDRGTVKATVFWAEIDNLIGFGSGPNCLPSQTFGCYIQTDGTTETRGLELSGSYAITDRVRVSGAYTLTNTENDGERVVRVPRHDLSLALEADVTDRLQVGINMTRVSDTLDGFGTLTPLDDYTVWDVSARYAITDMASVYGAIDNVGDVSYQTVRGFNAPDRTIRFGVETSF
ncbi:MULTISPECIES: TonB-dependent receptor plug domain-containing protein [Marivita]|uniref:TonB-dependent receptor n=1 Tax=Marivita cryptomonadis TaxID=505252 RepID=A0A9Q2P006_9RHOB|nr:MULTISPECIES: TonB-dependent receptor [Marivita]MCR9169278.1 TonB-dependent receptor [Paracoccaceae bacterium]MBM2323989.1 TonB-dependent receptor [Marivita cryptomonadis]MBM2333578.1 TonB-dependent receptor [Marivita cryptomonadis]MBM2343156.1 TonB-dependent receptor [Marivita cryptomonadis]MBM2347827.1 TonB-dependent receptor [Marivita cryptomonadis]